MSMLYHYLLLGRYVTTYQVKGYMSRQMIGINTLTAHIPVCSPSISRDAVRGTHRVGHFRCMYMYMYVYIPPCSSREEYHLKMPPLLRVQPTNLPMWSPCLFTLELKGTQSISGPRRRNGRGSPSRNMHALAMYVSDASRFTYVAAYQRLLYRLDQARVKSVRSGSGLIGRMDTVSLAQSISLLSDIRGDQVEM